MKKTPPTCADLYCQILGVTSPWKVVSVDISDTEKLVTAHLLYDPQSAVTCPICSKISPRYDSKIRRWRHLDSCEMATVLEAAVPRANCSVHGVHTIAVPFANKDSRYTSHFESHVIKWLHDASISAVAANLGLGWDAVEGIRDRAVRRGLARRGELCPKRVSIDETSEKKGHNYLTIVSEGARVLYVEKGRDMEAIDGFWKSLNPDAIQGVTSISMDLWQAYQSSTLKHVPDAQNKICLDRFHVAGYFGLALDKVRKAEHRELMGEGNTILSGIKYDLLRSDSNVDNRTSKRRTFHQIVSTALRTARAWAMKEAAHGIWEYVYTGAALNAWNKLFGWMQRSRIQPMVKLAASLKKHQWMILNAIKHNASNGCAEGNNSRIQKIKKIACGFRNTESFKNAIYFHLGGLDMTPCSLPT